MGVIAAVFVLLFKFSVLSSLFGQGDLASYGCVHCCCLRLEQALARLGHGRNGLCQTRGICFDVRRCPRKACGRCNDQVEIILLTLIGIVFGLHGAIC